MGQVKISALPQKTSTTVLDVLAIVDSGSTQTSKITLKDVRGLTNGAGVNSLISSSGLTSTGALASGTDCVSIGNGSTATASSGSTAFGSFANASSSNNTTAIGFASKATGNQSVSIGYQSSATGGDGVAIGPNAKNAGSDSVAIGGNTIMNNNSAVLIGKNGQGGDSNISIGYNIINYASQSTAVGTAIQHQSQVSGGITIGYANDMLDNGGGNTNVLIGYDRTMRAKGALWIASNSGLWVDYSDNSVMFGGRDNTMSGDTSIIINGSGNTASNLNTAIIGGTGNTASLQGALMSNTFNRTSVFSATTHMENQHTYLTKTFTVVDGGTVGGGDINVDLSLGTLYKFSLSGTVGINFINGREGQQVQFWVDNLSNYDVSGATISGGGSVYAKAGNINPTHNQISGYYGTIVSGDMFLDEHLNFQAV